MGNDLLLQSAELGLLEPVVSFSGVLHFGWEGSSHTVLQPVEL